MALHAWIIINESIVDILLTLYVHRAWLLDGPLTKAFLRQYGIFNLM